MTTTDDRPDSLSPQQYTAARVYAVTGSCERAAEAVDCSSRTVRRWRESPAFTAEVRSAARAAASEATSLLLGVQYEAVDALRRHLRNGTAATRVRAAAVLLDAGRRATDDDTETRLLDLERRAEQWQQTMPAAWIA